MMGQYETGPVGPETARTMRAMEDEYRAKLGLDPLPGRGTKTVPASQIMFGTGWIKPPERTRQDRLDLLRRAGFFDPKGGTK